ncbi:MAG: tetraacyldisaccharide 4'-kinase, partial [Polyangiaceae bacterium]
MIVASASRALARRLETGHFKGDFALVASRVWGKLAARGLVRQLVVPAELRVITIGGATIGGSGKTPVAIAWARREAERGARVVLIGHAYRGNPKRARVVSITDDVRSVGDEALVCARALSGIAEVIVAPSRQAAVDFAVERGATVVVLDGVAQIAPRRASVAVLVVDETVVASTACPPAGDLRAPRSALESVCDVVVRISSSAPASQPHLSACATSVGARTSEGRFVSFEALTKLRVGLALAIARPERVTRLLEANGVKPVVVSYVGDHRG